MRSGKRSVGKKYFTSTGEEFYQHPLCVLWEVVHSVGVIRLVPANSCANRMRAWLPVLAIMQINF